MPTYRLERYNGEVYELESDRELTLDELNDCTMELFGLDPCRGQVLPDAVARATGKGLVDAVISPIYSLDGLVRQVGVPIPNPVSTAVEDLRSWRMKVTPLSNPNEVNPIVCASYLLPVMLLWLLVVKLVHGQWRRRWSNRITSLLENPYDRAKSVGGWLFIFCILGCTLIPLGIIGRAGSFVPILKDSWYVVPKESMEGSVSPDTLWLRWLIQCHIGVSIAFAVGFIIVAVNVWRKSPTALLWLRRYAWLMWTWVGFYLLAFYQLNPYPDRWQIDVGTIVGGIISLLLWRAYFRKSKRVAETFGPWDEVAYRETTFLDELGVTRRWESFKRFFDSETTSGEPLESEPEATAETVKMGDPALSPPEIDDAAKWAPMKADKPSIPEPEVTEVAMAPVQAVQEMAGPLPVDPPKIETAPEKRLLNAYERLHEEQERGFYHPALWLKSITEADGVENKALTAYNRQRVAMLLELEE